MDRSDQIPTPSPISVRALYDWTGDEHGQLNFQKGNVITVITRMKSGWWDGVLDGKRGWFPSNYVELYEEPQERRASKL